MNINAFELGWAWSGQALPDSLVKHILDNTEDRAVIAVSGGVGSGAEELVPMLAAKLPRAEPFAWEESAESFPSLLSLTQAEGWVVCHVGSTVDSWSGFHRLRMSAVAENAGAGSGALNRVLDLPMMKLHAVWDWRARSGFILNF